MVLHYLNYVNGISGGRCGVYMSINDFDGEIGKIFLVDNTLGKSKTFPMIKELKVYNKDDQRVLTKLDTVN